MYRCMFQFTVLLTLVEASCECVGGTTAGNSLALPISGVNSFIYLPCLNLSHIPNPYMRPVRVAIQGLSVLCQNSPICQLLIAHYQ